MNNRQLAFVRRYPGAAAVVGNYIRRQYNRGNIPLRSNLREIEAQINSKRKLDMGQNGKSKRSRGSSFGDAIQSAGSNMVVAKRSKRRKKHKKKSSKVPYSVRKYVQSQIKTQGPKTRGKLFSYRKIDKLGFGCGNNACYYDEIIVFNRTKIAAALDAYGKQLSGAGAIETIDYTDSDAHTLKVSGKIKSRLVLRNNSSFTGEYMVWAVTPKVRSAASPKTSLIAGLDDFALADGGLETDPMYYPSDSKDFRKQWKVLASSGRVTLTGGGSLECFATAPFKWSNDVYTDHNYIYEKKNSMCWLIRVLGHPAHSTAAATEVGSGAAHADCIAYTKLDVRSVGEMNSMSHTESLNSLDTLTTPTQFQAEDPGEETYNT